MKSQTQKVGLSKLQPNADNPRFIKDEKYKKLKQSLIDFPEMLELRPIVVDESFTILGGNMRYRAAKEIGLKELFITVAEGLTDEQKKEFIIKDNASFGDWDWDVLANDWDDIDLGDWGVDVWESEEEVESEDEGDDVGDFSDNGISAKDQYAVIVVCTDENNQIETFNKLSDMGYECKVVVV